MKKIAAFFIMFACMVPCTSWSAVNVKNSGIKKAAPVATKQEEKFESATSLLPTVIGLVGQVRNLNEQQQQLSADCAPTSSEIQLVNDLVKEWAKTGSVTASGARGSGIEPCNRIGFTNTDRNEGGSMYEDFIRDADRNETCIETFSTDSAKGTIWFGFPKASSGKKCDVNNIKNCTTVSNVYDIFSLIKFTDEDYTVSEAAKIAQFKAKAERCAPAKINAAKRELYGNFVTQALGNVGQASGASGTESVLKAVSSMGGSSNLESLLPSLGTMAGQMLEK